MTKRRTKGDGSVYKRKDGRFMGEYTDALGKRRYVSGKSKSDVKAKLKEAIKACEEGIVPANITFGDYLDQWLESVRDAVGVRTYQRSEETVRLHIKPTLGKTKLEKLNALQLDQLYREKAKKLSPRSVQIIHATAHKALKQAAKWRMVRENVAKHATPPRSVKKETDVLTKEQVQILLKTAKKNQPKLYALIALAVTTGARLGELLGLQPADICMNTGTLRIARSVHNGRVSEPKTASGRKMDHHALQGSSGCPTGPYGPLRRGYVAFPITGEAMAHTPLYPTSQLLETASTDVRLATGDEGT